MASNPTVEMYNRIINLYYKTPQMVWEYNDLCKDAEKLINILTPFYPYIFYIQSYTSGASYTPAKRLNFDSKESKLIKTALGNLSEFVRITLTKSPYYTDNSVCSVNCPFVIGSLRQNLLPVEEWHLCRTHIAIRFPHTLLKKTSIKELFEFISIGASRGVYKIFTPDSKKPIFQSQHDLSPYNKIIIV